MIAAPRTLVPMAGVFAPQRFIRQQTVTVCDEYRDNKPANGSWSPETERGK